MSLVEKLGIYKKSVLDTDYRIDELSLKINDLKRIRKFDKLDSRSRQISQLVKGFREKDSVIEFTKTPDIFSAFSGRGDILVRESTLTEKQIEVIYKAKYEEFWFVLIVAIIAFLVMITMLYFNAIQLYWIFLFMGFFILVSGFKIFLFRNDIIGLEKELNDLMKLINNNP
ncbi:MAG: hypothetical protein CVT99_08750 [Bacteroidetes bacterium HGW-Bacteroidetes-16]|jgi:hypothetical protein|nr:MAG: hypothetical protein CVT99_08750 [Bacteroidetes bacterium HGW-Bacteroidetes-16]